MYVGRFATGSVKSDAVSPPVDESEPQATATKAMMSAETMAKRRDLVFGIVGKLPFVYPLISASASRTSSPETWCL